MKDRRIERVTKTLDEVIVELRDDARSRIDDEKIDQIDQALMSLYKVNSQLKRMANGGRLRR